MIDINYCYLDDVNASILLPEGYNSRNESKYKDPDHCSKKLYNDLLYIWNILSQRDELPKFNFYIDPRNPYNLLETNHKVRYSSDFIGPNRKFAHDVGLTDLEIGTYIKLQRTIGGHILFPLGEKITINQAKGTNVLDRFDFMLAELRNYFINVYTIGLDTVYEKKYSVALANSFELYKEWIMIFGSKEKDGIEAFKNYIHFWLLDVFVDKENEYQVISLVNSDLEKNLLHYIDDSEPYFPGLANNPLRVNINSIRRQLFATEDKSTYVNLYRKYIKNSTYAIQERNKKIKYALMCKRNKY